MSRHAPMTAYGRLREWAEQLHYPGWDIPQTTGGVLGRLSDEGQDERLRSIKGKAKRMRMIRGTPSKRRRGRHQVPCKETRCAKVKVLVHDGEAFSTTPDGGMGLMVDRMSGDIEQMERCREVSKLYHKPTEDGGMPLDYKSYVDATFRSCASPGEVPREWEEAARIMGTGRSAYFDREKKVLAWFTERLWPVAGQQNAA